jgi:hypothetical protein
MVEIPRALEGTPLPLSASNAGRSIKMRRQQEKKGRNRYWPCVSRG